MISLVRPYTYLNEKHVEAAHTMILDLEDSVTKWNSRTTNISYILREKTRKMFLYPLDEAIVTEVGKYASILNTMQKCINVMVDMIDRIKASIHQVLYDGD
jgi:hypothetical protein